MAHDSDGILCGKLNDSIFSIQVDESTDPINKCHVLAFVRYVNEGEIQENFLYCKELPETSKRIDLFISILISYHRFILISEGKRSLQEGFCWHLYWWSSIIEWLDKRLCFSCKTRKS